MWEANICINSDTFNKKIKYIFPKILQYKHLYDNLNNFVIQDLYVLDFNVDNYIVEFIFDFYGTKTIIKDWDKYILNNDNITINLTIENKIIFILFDSYDNTEMIKSTDIEDLYDYSRKLNQDFPLLIYAKKLNKFKLIDVLENHNYYLNSCINRLIHKYNY